MAARLGLKPWERKRMSPAQIKEMWEGMVWRRSRDIEILAHVLTDLMRVQGSDTDYDRVLARMPQYDGEHERLLAEQYGMKPPED